MSYTALYRKFRPDNFKDVKGQDHIVTTLKNQIEADRLGHAYLFCGTRGTGKTSIAKLFAKAVNCEAPKEGSPCGECPSCRAIVSGASMNVIEIDAASNNGVDNIREIVDEVSYSPAEGKYKVYIIDEVHMLSIGAFNALLKTLEEPPSYVIFILATTEVHKIPITILSRCQRYDFKRISIDTIVGRLQELMEAEHIPVEEKALRFVAKTADGSMRDALSLLDQCIAFHFGQELTYEKTLDVLGAVDTEVFSKLFRLILARDIPGCIHLLEDIIMQGRELTQFVNDLSWYLRNLLLVKTSDNMEEMLDFSRENLNRLKEEAKETDAETILRYIRIFAGLASQMKYAVQKRILVEVALIKLCKPEMETSTDSLLDRIRSLEEKLEQGIALSPQNVGGWAGSQPPEMVNTAPQAPKILPQALPEELKQVGAKWQGIVAEATMPLKSYLRKVRPSAGEGKNLLLVTEDGVVYDYLSKPDNQAAVLQLIENFLGKTLEIEIRSLEENRSFEASYVDLSQIINMEIEEENE
ncbi:MAG: DNA polymerase III subunit gamma/tau [Lachnospiraceae bacterium]|nr:DNA polymerase III subunit gamma/tau [Lachnospiraceae bacterium]